MASICVLCCEIQGAEVAQVDKLSEALSQARDNFAGPSQVQSDKLGELVCPFCVDTIEVAIVRKEDLISTEKRVRKLESLLLKLKGQLEGSVTGYREQMKEVNEIIKDSHQRIAYLDTYFGEQGTKADLKEAINIRNDMLSVVRELRDFGKTLELPKSLERGGKSADPPEEAPAAPEAENAVNGSSLELTEQEERAWISGDAVFENDEPEVVSCSRDNPITRSCTVLLQRISVPLAERVAEHDGEVGVPVAASAPEESNHPTTHEDNPGKVVSGGVATKRVTPVGKVNYQMAVKPNKKKHYPSFVDKMWSRQCLFCRTTCWSSRNLEVHMCEHTGERPFICGFCGQEFNVAVNLKRHQRIHTGEKPYRCTLCPKRFALDGNLSRHVRLHLGEKPWKCPDCGKAFGDKSGLNRHRVVHTGETPFECDQCPKKYSYPDHLTKHKKRKHPKLFLL